MKRVIKEKDENVIPLGQIDNSSIVGIDWGSSKCMVIRVSFNTFQALSNYSGTLNLLNAWERVSQFEYVESALAQGSHVKAYVFDDTKELFNWMSK